jgi:predicted permease
LEVGGPDYFRTIGIPLLRGRGFLDSDRAEGPLVAVVSEAVARRVWPNENPVGKRIRYWGADSATWRTVVGVAGDIRYRSLREPNPSVYIPWRQGYWQGGFAIRTTGSLGAVLPALRREIRAVDPQLSLWHARTMDDLLAGPLAQPRLSAMLLSGFGLAALLLAAVGLYGVMASAVREQTRELGIRMALGATAGRVRRDVLGRALGVTVVGAVIGVAGALASSRLFTALLFEVSPTDPLTLAGVCALLVGVGGAAAYLPARRATKVDPARALRAD